MKGQELLDKLIALDHKKYLGNYGKIFFFIHVYDMIRSDF